VINPLRVSVVVTGFVLAIPVLLLGLRGELTAQEVVTRLLWCLAAGWAAVSVVTWASAPPPAPPKTKASATAAAPEPEGEPAPTA
jgi:hypothetical protein